MKKAQALGIVFTLVIGTLLHFMYEWTGESLIAAAFSAVNESLWEHLKLLVVPMLLFGIIEYFYYGKALDNFVTVRFLSILLGMAIIIFGFYTYSGAWGQNLLLVDILLFVLAVLLAYFFSFIALQKHRFDSPAAKWASIIGIFTLIALFVWFTFSPPHIPLFIDTETGLFGVDKR